ncbi:CutC family protein [Diaporthe helianthi]|uniref:Copper homeostasis protein cutC homolog n=1 Tax=Diaporthe helianthi TaxID=158607 RepID=A0A2P5IA85_DIAHE|nr:CutC family protein [Diaporthe helianthi]
MARLELEVPVFSPGSARVALTRASRLELNRAGSYPQGGLTPELSDVQSLSSVPAPLRIMIRPRGPPEDGPDFIYSPSELEEMKRDIQLFKSSGHLHTERGDGFVFGILKASDEPGEGPLLVDADTNSELVRLASPFRCVFHRAFDDILGSGGSSSSSSTVEEAVHAVKACGFDGVLTSGGPGSAADNLDMLARVVHAAAAAENGIEVIVGGGVRSSNARVLRERLPRPEGSRVLFHSSCLTKRSGDVIDADELSSLGDVLA